MSGMLKILETTFQSRGECLKYGANSSQSFPTTKCNYNLYGKDKEKNGFPWIKIYLISEEIRPLINFLSLGASILKV